MRKNTHVKDTRLCNNQNNNYYHITRTIAFRNSISKASTDDLESCPV
jgi:hypothetical protein